MDYQVFAIRTRPQSFSEVIGQQAIVSALTHALDQNKLHHAYLFTGTRGVGKTTLARIIAKSLNCEQGVSSKPCNKCSNCQSISEGNFPDLIEIDAASKTKVEDTRALLDTVIYAPTRGRTKIYLIDEVHMLSTHSFNALLKTLEEPPEHVKFLLATTDPQKIPATIVSRCLQFTLKWVDSAVIASHIESILTKDNIKFESQAIKLIAQAAQGSVRDSLSLLEQAVALGAGEVCVQQVQLMLGRVDATNIISILEHLIKQDCSAIINQVNTMAQTGVDFEQVLTQLIYALHQVSVLKHAPDIAYELDVELEPQLLEIAQRINAQDLQIYYQIALLAKRDMPYSPQPKLALEMALIRMVNFVPVNTSPNKANNSNNTQNANSSNSSIIQAASTASTASVTSMGMSAAVKQTAPIKRATQSTQSTLSIQGAQPSAAFSSAIGETEQTQDKLNRPTKSTWSNWISQLKFTGIHLQIFRHAEFVSFNDNQLVLNIDSRLSALVNAKRIEEIEQKLTKTFQAEIKLVVNKADKDQEVNQTPANIEQNTRIEKHQKLVENLQSDPNINKIINTFNGELRLDSVELTEDNLD